MGWRGVFYAYEGHKIGGIMAYKGMCGGTPRVGKVGDPKGNGRGRRGRRQRRRRRRG